MDTHIINKSDLLRMITENSQYGDSKIVVELTSGTDSENGDVILLIDRVRYGQGKIRIVCLGNTGDREEIERLERELGEAETGMEELESKISQLVDMDLENMSKEEIIQEIGKLRTAANV